MKRLLILLVLVLWGTCSYSQDIIIKNNGEELKADVLEITLENNIKYELFNSSDRSVKMIEPDKVFMIIYENGEREKFVNKDRGKDKKEGRATLKDQKDRNNNRNQQEHEENQLKPIKEEKETPAEPSGKSGYFALGAGYGYSYGGAGLKMQVLSSGSTRVGFHGGVGYFPRLGGWFLYSGGIQVYFLDNTYFDAQFGTFGVKKFAYSEFTSSIDGQSFESGSEASRLYGPSLQVGYDWFLGDNFGLNLASGVSYNINQPEFADAINYNGFGWAVDVGLIIRF